MRIIWIVEWLEDKVGSLFVLCFYLPDLHGCSMRTHHKTVLITRTITAEVTMRLSLPARYFCRFDKESKKALVVRLFKLTFFPVDSCEIST